MQAVDAFELALETIAGDGFLIERLSMAAIETRVKDLAEGALCLVCLDHDAERESFGRILAADPRLSLLAWTSGDPTPFFPFLKQHHCGALLLARDLPELLNNTVHAFYAGDPDAVFSIPAILKGRFTVDERCYERRQRTAGAVDADHRQVDRRTNRVIQIGSIFEFGDDPRTIRTRILDTVQRFFFENGLDFLLEEMTVQIGIDELISNILKHAYDNGEQKLAHLLLIEDRQRAKLILLIQDYKGRFTKKAFLDEMVRTYGSLENAGDLGLQGTGFRFVRQCSDLLVVNIIHGVMTKFILIYDIERLRRQEYPSPGEKSMLVFEFGDAAADTAGA